MAKKLQTKAQREDMWRRANNYRRGVFQDGNALHFAVGEVTTAWGKGFEAGLRAAAKRYAERANGER
jgi:hypothetical protein